MANGPPNNQFIKVIYTKYHRKVLNFLGRKNITSDMAEDIVQDAYYRLSRHENLGLVEHPKAYFFRTVKNIMLNEARKNNNRDYKKHIPFDDELDLGQSIPPLREIEDRQQLAKFEKALERLPSKYRDTFILQRYEGLSYSQIARLQRIGVSTVGKYLTHAITVLKAEMERDDVK